MIRIKPEVEVRPIEDSGRIRDIKTWAQSTVRYSCFNTEH